jgi:mannosylglucosylglycerate synthase
MKISILHYSSTPMVGGVERVIHAHALKFAENGCGVKIITGKGGRFDRRVEVCLVPEMRALHIVSGKIHREILEGIISRDFEELKEKIREKIKPLIEDTDICIIHNVLTMHFNLALTAALHDIKVYLMDSRRDVLRLRLQGIMEGPVPVEPSQGSGGKSGACGDFQAQAEKDR